MFNNSIHEANNKLLMEIIYKLGQMDDALEEMQLDIDHIAALVAPEE